MYKEALSDYRKVSELVPSDVVALYNTGVVYNTMGKSSEAAEVYNQVLAKNSKYVNAYLNLAGIHSKRGETKKMLETYMALWRNARNSTALYFLGATYDSGDKRHISLAIWKLALEWIDARLGITHGKRYNDYYERLPSSVTYDNGLSKETRTSLHSTLLPSLESEAQRMERRELLRELRRTIPANVPLAVEEDSHESDNISSLLSTQFYCRLALFRLRYHFQQYDVAAINYAKLNSEDYNFANWARQPTVAPYLPSTILFMGK